MGICWYCYWGWAKEVLKIYKKALKDLSGYESPLHYGPAHIVWEDENFDSAEICLKEFYKNSSDYSERELSIVKRSLEELTTIPLNIRCPEPEDYDGEHPELYPPKKEIK